MSREKTLCEIFKKEMKKDDLKEYAKLVINSEYICKKCGRAANSEKYLCKPHKIK